ncbi:hypothetical protein ACLLKL_001992 [Escherichia coli]
MADETLHTLPDTGIEATLPAKPDSAYAYAWAQAHGGKIAAYGLTGTTPNIKAVVIGYWVCAAPVRNPYDGIFHHSTVPPQWRSVDSKSAFEINNNDPAKRTYTIDPATGEKVWTDHPGNNGMTNQPDWNWKPEQLAAKPNKLN